MFKWVLDDGSCTLLRSFYVTIIAIVIVIAAAVSANDSPSVAAEWNIGWNGMGWIDYLIRHKTMTTTTTTAAVR